MRDPKEGCQICGGLDGFHAEGCAIVKHAAERAKPPSEPETHGPAVNYVAWQKAAFHEKLELYRQANNGTVEHRAEIIASSPKHHSRKDAIRLALCTGAVDMLDSMLDQLYELRLKLAAAEKPQLRVVAAAVCVDSLIYSLPAPARHSDVRRELLGRCGFRPLTEDQGFLLSDGRFASRAAAAMVARGCGQTKQVKAPLTTDDLW